MSNCPGVVAGELPALVTCHVEVVGNYVLSKHDCLKALDGVLSCYMLNTDYFSCKTNQDTWLHVVRIENHAFDATERNTRKCVQSGLILLGMLV